MTLSQDVEQAYLKMVPWAFRLPFASEQEQKPCVISPKDALFISFALRPGNRTPTWLYLSTRHLTSGVFTVPPLSWYDPSNHPNVEVYYILSGTLHLSNPQTGHVIELAQGDIAIIPRFVYHYGHNFQHEECVVLWWVPGAMHPDDLIANLVKSGGDWAVWYEGQPMVLNGVHSEEDVLSSQLGATRSWPSGAGLREGSQQEQADLRVLTRREWLHAFQGSDPRARILTSMFYADSGLQCGEVHVPLARESETEVVTGEKLLYIASDEFVVNLPSSGEALLGTRGDMIFVPRDTPHSYEATGNRPAQAFFAVAM